MWNAWYHELVPVGSIWNEWKILRSRHNNFNWTKVFVEWTHLRSFYFLCVIFFSFTRSLIRYPYMCVLWVEICFLAFLVFPLFYPILFTPRFTWTFLDLLLLLLFRSSIQCSSSTHITQCLFMYSLTVRNYACTTFPSYTIFVYVKRPIISCHSIYIYFTLVSLIFFLFS